MAHSSLPLSAAFQTRKLPFLYGLMLNRNAEDKAAALTKVRDTVASMKWEDFGMEEPVQTGRGRRAKPRGGGRTATARKRAAADDITEDEDVPPRTTRITRAQTRGTRTDNQTSAPVSEDTEDAGPPKSARVTRAKRGKNATVDLSLDAVEPSSSQPTAIQASTTSAKRATPARAPAVDEESAPPSKSRTRGRLAKKCAEIPPPEDEEVGEERRQTVASADVRSARCADTAGDEAVEPEAKAKRAAKTRTKAKPTATRRMETDTAEEVQEDGEQSTAVGAAGPAAEPKECMQTEPQLAVDSEEPGRAEVAPVAPAKKPAARTRRANKATAAKTAAKKAADVNADPGFFSGASDQTNASDASSRSRTPLNAATDVVAEPSADLDVIHEGRPESSKEQVSKSGVRANMGPIADDSSIVEVPVDDRNLNPTVAVNASVTLDGTFVVDPKGGRPPEKTTVALKSLKRLRDGSVIASPGIAAEDPASNVQPPSNSSVHKKVEKPSPMEVDIPPSSSSSVVESSVVESKRVGAGGLETTQEESEGEVDFAKENEKPNTTTASGAPVGGDHRNAPVDRRLSAKHRSSVHRLSGKTPGQKVVGKYLRQSAHKAYRAAAASAQHHHVAGNEADCLSPRTGIPVRAGTSSTVKKAKPPVLPGSSTAIKERRVPALPTFQPRHPSCSPQNRAHYKQANMNAVLSGAFVSAKKKVPGNISTQTSFVKRPEPQVPSTEELARAKREEEERKKAEHDARAREKQRDEERRRELERQKNEEKQKRARENAALREEEKKQRAAAKLKEKELRAKATKQAEEKAREAARRKKHEDEEEQRRRAAEREERERREAEEARRRKQEAEEEAKRVEEQRRAEETRRLAEEKKKAEERRRMEEVMKKREQERAAALAAANAPKPSTSKAGAMNSTFVVADKKLEKKTKKKYEAYNIDNIDTDAETDNEESPKNPIPAWASDRPLHKKLCENLEMNVELNVELKRKTFPKLPNPTADQLFSGMRINPVKRDEMTMIWEREPTWEMTYDQEHFEGVDQ